MTDFVDARGFSCPQPVILARQKMQSLGRGTFEVKVDTDTARENITRLAQKEGWDVEIKEAGREYVLVLTKR
ncbi:MAG: sulfurtransferase TusA family protein [Thermodesulfobacteriota bacterium]|nr:sulfurtransferase TusA family protein [Thermodesulfobacteriota bacterium]